MDEYYLFTFVSTHAAISTERLLKVVDCVTMPVPRFLSSSCGIAVRISIEKHEESEKLFKEKSKLKAFVNEEEEYDYKYYHIQIKSDNDVKYELVTI